MSRAARRGDVVTVVGLYPNEPDAFQMDVELIDVEAGGIWWLRPNGVAAFTPWLIVLEMRFPHDADDAA